MNDATIAPEAAPLPSIGDQIREKQGPWQEALATKLREERAANPPMMVSMPGATIEPVPTLADQAYAVAQHTEEWALLSVLIVPDAHRPRPELAEVAKQLAITKDRARLKVEIILDLVGLAIGIEGDPERVQKLIQAGALRERAGLFKRAPH